MAAAMSPPFLRLLPFQILGQEGPVGQHTGQLHQHVGEAAAAVKAHGGGFQHLALLRRPEGEGDDGAGAPPLLLLNHDGAPVGRGDAAGHPQAQAQAPRPLEQGVLVGLRRKARPAVPHGDDRPAVPPGQAHPRPAALSRRPEGIGDQVEQHPAQLGGVPVGEQAAVLLPGEGNPGQLRQGAHLPPQLPAHAGQIQGGLPQGRVLLGQLQVLQVAHHAHHAVQALVQDGQIGVVLRAPLLLHHRGEQLHRRRQVVHLLPELLRQERPQILRLKCQTAPLLPVIHSLCRPALNSYGKASITKFGSSLKRKCRNLSKPPRLPILPL